MANIKWLACIGTFLISTSCSSSSTSEWESTRANNNATRLQRVFEACRIKSVEEKSEALLVIYRDSKKGLGLSCGNATSLEGSTQWIPEPGYIAGSILLAMGDPAVPTVSDELMAERNPRHRELLIDLLIRIGTPKSMKSLRAYLPTMPEGRAKELLAEQLK